jgi:hypothetical protein
LTKASLDTINTRLNTLLDLSNTATSTSNITKCLNIFSLKSESFFEFNAITFSRVQITYLLFA